MERGCQQARAHVRAGRFTRGFALTQLRLPNEVRAQRKQRLSEDDSSAYASLFQTTFVIAFVPSRSLASPMVSRPRNAEAPAKKSADIHSPITTTCPSLDRVDWEPMAAPPGRGASGRLTPSALRPPEFPRRSLSLYTSRRTDMCHNFIDFPGPRPWVAVSHKSVRRSRRSLFLTEGLPLLPGACVVWAPVCGVSKEEMCQDQRRSRQ